LRDGCNDDCNLISAAGANILTNPPLNTQHSGDGDQAGDYHYYVVCHLDQNHASNKHCCFAENSIDFKFLTACL
jgi:hypothetical protein